jgi:hypothetical protein
MTDNKLEKEKEVLSLYKALLTGYIILVIAISGGLSTIISCNLPWDKSDIFILIFGGICDLIFIIGLCLTFYNIYNNIKKLKNEYK